MITEKRYSFLSLSVAILCSACSPHTRPQVIVSIDTDAIVPGVFDRLRVTVLDTNRQIVPGGAREFGGDEIAPSSGQPSPVAAPLWPVSIGIVLAPGERRLVRVQLYLSGRLLPVAAGERASPEMLEPREPDPNSTITVTGELTGGVGIQRYSLFVPMKCLHRAGTEPDCPAFDGSIALQPFSDQPSRVNSWRSEVSRTCSGEGRGDDATRTTEGCIPGGAYWMGDRRLSGTGGIQATFPEHLVVLKSFYLDRFEYTVGRYRAALRDGRLRANAPIVLMNPAGSAAFVNGVPVVDAQGRPPCGNPDSATLNPDGMAADTRCCNYVGPDDPSRDNYPLNCITPLNAPLLCMADGKRLPSEAEWEWAASNRDQHTLHSWGDTWQRCQNFAGLTVGPLGDVRACPTAPLLIRSTVVTGMFGCYDPAFRPAICDMVPAGFDRTRDGISDMMGNVQELVQDGYAPYTDECWQNTELQVSPVCSNGIVTSTRGGSFAETGPSTYFGAARAFWSSYAFRAPHQGFRCARDAQ